MHAPTLADELGPELELASGAGDDLHAPSPASRPSTSTLRAPSSPEPHLPGELSIFPPPSSPPLSPPRTTARRPPRSATSPLSSHSVPPSSPPWWQTHVLVPLALSAWRYAHTHWPEFAQATSHLANEDNTCSALEPSGESAASFDRPSSDQEACPAFTQPRTGRLPPALPPAFGERFKYLICTSCLLTPNLAIASYEDAPDAPPASALDTDWAKNPLTDPWEHVRQLIVQAVPTDPGDVERLGLRSHMLAPYAASAAALLARLDETIDSDASRAVRTSTAAALVGLAACFRATGLIVASLGLALLALARLSVQQPHPGWRSGEERSVRFRLASAASPANKEKTDIDIFGPAFGAEVYRAMVQTQEQDLAGECWSQTLSLLAAMRRWDVEARHVLRLVKEAEILHRGYRLTTPLVPISRIEVANFDSSARSARAGDRMRQLPLRKILLDQTRQMDLASRALTEALLQLDVVDLEEWDLLRDMYALDAPGRPQPSTGWNEVESSPPSDVGSPRPTRLPLTLGSLSWYARSEDRRSSLASPPASLAARRQKRLSSVSLSSQNQRLTSAMSTPRNGYKRISLLSPGTSPILGSSLAYDGPSGTRTPSPAPPVDEMGNLTRARSLSYASRRKRMNMRSLAAPAGGLTRSPSDASRSALINDSLAHARGASLGVLSSPTVSPPLHASKHAPSLSNGIPYKSANRAPGSSLFPLPRSPDPSTTALASASAPASEPDEMEGEPSSRHSVASTSMSIGSTLPSSVPKETNSGLQLSLQPASSHSITHLAETSANELEPDPLSLMSLQGAHDALHAARRGTLVRLLALGFDVPHAPGTWAGVKSALSTARQAWAGSSSELQCALERALVPQNNLSTSRTEPEHSTGWDNRLSKMSHTLRAVQVKLINCAEEWAVSPGTHLHGQGQDATSGPSSAAEDQFRSIQEDIALLQSEWQGGMDVLAGPERPPAEITSGMGEEGEWTAGPDEGTVPASPSTEATELVSSAAPPAMTEEVNVKDTLPPPGEEEVYESEALPPLSREERIALRRAKAQEPVESRDQLEPQVMLDELAAVMALRKRGSVGTNPHPKAPKSNGRTEPKTKEMQQEELAPSDSFAPSMLGDRGQAMAAAAAAKAAAAFAAQFAAPDRLVRVEEEGA